MTVIVAARTKDKGIVLAADRQITLGWSKTEHDEPKLWVSDKWAFGVAGSVRVAQVLKHQVTWPKYRPDEDTDWEAFLVKTVVPAIRSGVQGHGVLVDDSGVHRLQGGSLLIVATADKMGMVSPDGSVLTASCGRDAVGSGADHAIGALGSKGPWTEADVIKAARCAAESAVGVGGPISVVNTKQLTVRTLSLEEAA